MLDDDDGTDEGHRRICVGCTAVAPDTSTSYTLISAKHGWRLARRVARDGTTYAEWRCPTCWQSHKDRQRATEEAQGTLRRISTRMAAVFLPEKKHGK